MPEEEKIEFENHVIQLFEKLRKIPSSAKEVFLWDVTRHAASCLCEYRIACVDKRKIKYTYEDSTFIVRVDADKDDNTLSITHKGVGLKRHELKDVLGCVSADIVNNFFDTIDQYLMNGDPKGYYSALLGEESCLGLYSAFMVADRVVITTTSKPKKKHVPAIEWDASPRVQYVWDARASDGFFRLTRVDPKPQDPLMKRGSKITLYLRNEYLEYLDETRLRELVDNYTFDACPYPIYVSADHEREKKRQCIKVREEELESLKKDFEGLRELCVIALETTGSQVELVVVDDRVFDLPGHVSNNGKTFVINPRSPELKSLLEDYNKNPDSLKKKKMVMSTFIMYSRIFSATFLSPLPLRPPPSPETYLSKLGRYVDDENDNERKRKRKRKRTRRTTMRMSMRMMIEGSRP